MSEHSCRYARGRHQILDRKVKKGQKFSSSSLHGHRTSGEDFNSYHCHLAEITSPELTQVSPVTKWQMIQSHWIYTGVWHCFLEWPDWPSIPTVCCLVDIKGVRRGNGTVNSHSPIQSGLLGDGNYSSKYKYQLNSDLRQIKGTLDRHVLLYTSTDHLHTINPSFLIFPSQNAQICTHKSHSEVLG